MARASGSRSIPTRRTSVAGGEDRLRVPAEAERRVDVDAAALRPERLEDLPEEDGDVRGPLHGASASERAGQIVVVLIGDRRGREGGEVPRLVDDLERVGLREDEDLAPDSRRLAQEGGDQETALAVHRTVWP